VDLLQRSPVPDGVTNFRGPPIVAQPVFTPRLERLPHAGRSDTLDFLLAVGLLAVVLAATTARVPLVNRRLDMPPKRGGIDLPRH